MELNAEMVLGAISALGGAIVYLWRSQVVSTSKTETKLERCEDGHRESHAKMMEITDKLGELRGRQAGITDLAESVLKTVAEVVVKAQRGELT